MPNEVFFDLLGLPESGPDRARLERWVHELKDRKPDDARLTPVAKAATAGIQSYFVDLLNERRREPRADLVTHLVTAEIDGVPFAEEHIDAGLGDHRPDAGAVPRRGGEHRRAASARCSSCSPRTPTSGSSLRANPALIPDAVEEAIRIATPLQLVGRTTSREVTLHGVTIPAGGRVVLVYGAANRDERRFPDPDRFDVTRGRQRHLGFGEGMHGCLGAPLARLEAKVALEEALPVLGDYTIPGRRALPHDPEHVRLGAPAPVVPGRPAAPSRRASRQLAHIETGHHRTDSHRRHPRARDPGPRRRPSSSVADGVVALTLRAGRRPPAAGLDAGRARRPAARRPGVPTRQYSLCGDPADRTAYRLGVLRDPDGGGGSRYVHDRLTEGDLVRVRGPRNNFALAASPRYLFIAGGIGITPILPMIAAAEAAGAEWNLVYGGRHAGVHGVPRRAGPLRRPGHDRTRRTRPACSTWPPCWARPQPDTLVYCCGPEPLLAAVEQRCAAWPAGALHVERFAARPVERAGPRRGVRGRAGAQRAHPDRPAGPLDPRRRRGRGGGGAVLLRRGHLRHLRDRRCSTGGPTTATRCSPTRSEAADDCMLICVSRSCTDRLVLDL